MEELSATACEAAPGATTSAPPPVEPEPAPTTTTTTTTRRSSQNLERRKRASSSSGIRRKKNGTSSARSSSSNRRSKEAILGDGSSAGTGTATATVATSISTSTSINSGDIKHENDKKANSERNLPKEAAEETHTSNSSNSNSSTSRRPSQKSMDSDKISSRSLSPKQSLAKLADATTQNETILDTSAANTSAAGSTGNGSISTSTGNTEGRKNKQKSGSGKNTEGTSKSSTHKHLTDASLPSARKRSSSRHSHKKLSHQSERTKSTRRVTQSNTTTTNGTTTNHNNKWVDASERYSTKHVSDRRRQLMVGKAQSERMDSSSAANVMSQSTQQHTRCRSSSNSRALTSNDRALSTTHLAVSKKRTLIDRSKPRSRQSRNNPSHETMPSLTPQSSMDGVDMKLHVQPKTVYDSTEQQMVPSNDTLGGASNNESSEPKEPNDDHRIDGEIDAKGFPASSSCDSQSARPPNFLPDFPVGNFSFGDLQFPFDSHDSNDNDTALDNKDDTKTKSDEIHVAKVEETTVQEMDEKTAQEMATTVDEAKDDPRNTGIGKTPDAASESPDLPAPPGGNISTTTPVVSAKTTWECTSCREHHDESHLEFCGMCGTKRARVVTPKPVRGTRKSASGKRSSSRPSRPSSAHRSPTPAGGDSEKRQSSTGSLRRVRSKDGTRTPRSRSKGKVTAQSSDNLPPTDMMVVKCLDDDEGKALDIDALNAQFNTFDEQESLKQPPSRPKKKPIRRSQSDLTHESAKGISAAPLTPRSRRQKGMQRANSINVKAPSTPRKMSHLPNPKSRPSVRQAIPRRSKSSTTEYLQQLKKEAAEAKDDQSEHSAKLTLQSRSAHSISRPTLSGSATPSSGRPSLMKAASSRLLGGLGTVVNATGLSSAAGMFSRQKSGVLLSDSEDEFANDSGAEAKKSEGSPSTSMLRDFPSVDMTKSPGRRPRGSSCEPQPTSRPPIVAPKDDNSENQHMRTPRRRRASLDARATPVSDEAKATAGKSMWDKWGKSPKKKSSREATNSIDYDNDDDNDYDEAGDDNDYYDDIDIDEDEDVEVYGEETPDPTLTPRRIRQRMPRRPMSRRDQQVGGKKDHATPGKYMTPRQRLRRASITADAMKAPLPMLDDTDDVKKPPPTNVEPHSDGRKVRRASLGHVQETPNSVPAVSSTELPASASAHGINQGRPGVRAVRSRRRASVQHSNPILQRTLAHMPQDPTHAVRGDLKDEWKKQEQMEDMRKKASKMQKRFQGAAMMNTNSSTGGMPFEADFSTEGDAQQSVEEDGADLEVPADQEDVSDMSSRDGLE